MSIHSTSAGVTSAITSPTASPKAALQPSDVAKVHAPVAKAEPTKKVDLGYDPTQERVQLQQAIDQLNAQMKDKNRDLSFSLDERINRTIITVKKLETGEVVRQIPTEQVIKLAHSIEDMKGLLFNELL